MPDPGADIIHEAKDAAEKLTARAGIVRKGLFELLLGRDSAEDEIQQVPPPDLDAEEDTRP